MKQRWQNPRVTRKTIPPAELAKRVESPEVRIVLNETGKSGLQEYGGFVNEAYNAQLYWPAVQSVYSRLRRSMPEIVMIRQAFTAWARNIGIKIELPDKPSDDDKQYQEFVYQIFDDMAGGETMFLDTLVNHVPFMGWGWWEAVPCRRSLDWRPPDGDEWRSQYDDGLVGLRRLAWRDPVTFYGWEFDERKHLRGMKQQVFGSTPVTLPLANSLHMTFGDPNNPEGLSPLEAVWRLERIKFGLEVVQGIGFEHAAGYLNVQKTEPGKLSSTDEANIKKAARAILSAQEGNYAAWPHGMEGEVKDIPFAASPSLLEAIRYYGILVLSVYAMQWMALNTMTSTGALASATDSSQMGVFTFNAMMDGFAAQLDAQIGRRLWEWNRAYFPSVTARPKISFTHVDKGVALAEMGQFLQATQLVLPLGDEDLKAIRKRTSFLPETLPEPVVLPKSEPIPEPFATKQRSVEPGQVEAAMTRLEELARKHDPKFYKQLKRRL